MYQPPHFTETDRERIISFIQAHPFATLIAHDGQKSVATQIPVMLEEKEDTLYITGHVFKHTDHYKALEHNPEVLLLFSGAHCYVSASWYNSRGQASTWNYMSVQARGTVSILDDNDTYELIKDLTHQYEDEQDQPELTENMDEAYLAAHIKAIAGFEIAVTDLNATFKLNQNKDDESYTNVVAQLMNTNDIDSITIAGEMMKLRPELFS